MKAQVALEYLFVAGIGIFVLIPIFYYALTYASESLSISQAQNTVDDIAKTADYAYSLGVGTNLKKTITIPNNVVNSSIANKTILLKIQTSSGLTDAVALTKATVNGSLPTKSGYYNIFFNSTEQGVQIKT